MRILLHCNAFKPLLMTSSCLIYLIAFYGAAVCIAPSAVLSVCPCARHTPDGLCRCG